MSDRNAIRSQARQIAVTDPLEYVLLRMLFLKYAKKMSCMMHYLHHYQIIERAYKTLSCIKTEPEELVLAPLKPGSDRM